MKILVTGAKGFVGKNLCAQLNNIKDGKYVVPLASPQGATPLAPQGSSPLPSQGATPLSSQEASPLSLQETTPLSLRGAQRRGNLQITEIYQYDIDSTPADLDRYCRDCDFVFNLAGVNRPQNQEEFMQGNFGFASLLLDTLKKHGNTCPVMISSSIQATLAGRFGTSEYGKSKKAGEELMFEYGRETGAKVLVYRFPNLFGKWCRPNYNSAIATFCHNIANDLPIQVNDRSVEMELLYIDDLVDEMIHALIGGEHRCDYDGIDVVPAVIPAVVPAVIPAVVPAVVPAVIPTVIPTVVPAVVPAVIPTVIPAVIPGSTGDLQGRYCYCPTTHKATLGEIVDLIYSFADQPKTLTIPSIPENSLAKKLYSTYLSYLPKEKVAFPLKMNVDDRGSFTELIHTLDCGQVSINISKPGITKGQHWHNTKWEFFIVVSGHGLIQQRRIDSDEVLNFEVSGDKIQAVHMLPGYTHNIINLSETENLVTVMYCNEIFNPNKPDTYFEPVE